MDFTEQAAAVTRSVFKDVVTLTNGKPARTICLHETFPVKQEELWDIISKPERLDTWFAPVSGDLRLNGRYAIKGNASGTVTECNPPNDYAMSWEFEDSISAVRVRLQRGDKDNETTKLGIQHTFPIDSHWKKYGPGGGGVGWDMTLLGLALHLRGLNKPSEEKWAASKEAAAFTELASERWCEAAIEGGENEKWAKEAKEKTKAFYLPGRDAASSKSDK